MFMFMLPEVALSVALFLGLHLTANGSMNTGQLASYFATATLVVGPVRMLGMLFGQAVNATTALDRSEERRVGKECRSRWGAYDEKNKGDREVDKTNARSQQGTQI